VSQYQKGKTNLDFIEARDSEWQWHQLGHMQICTSLRTNNHASTPPLSFFTGRMPFLPPNQQRQSTEGTTAGTTNTETHKYITTYTQKWQHTNNLAPVTRRAAAFWSDCSLSSSRPVTPTKSWLQ